MASGEDKSGEEAVTPFSSGDNHFDIDLNAYKPAALSLPKTATFTSSSGSSYLGFVDADGNEVSDYTKAEYEDVEYTINDASCGDLDGDGEYELIIKWDCNGKDNSQTGLTGNVYLDAYKLDGTQLWRIDLGQNIRAGAHYTQFLVYDFDGDGYAEMMTKTAPGSKDNSGAYVASVSSVSTIKNVSDSTNEYEYVNDYGYILDGDEYLTVFNGETGKAVDTIYYPNQRVAVSVWGDTYGNRCDRYTAAVAYLDGTNPYAVFMRGYYFGSNNYQRQAACAVSFNGSTLSCNYSFDTYDVTSYSSKNSSSSYDSSEKYKGVDGYESGNEKYVGEGNHNCTVADVDNDGKDEVLTGALCYGFNDSKLTVEWCTYLQHGDALHIGDYDPTHDGYEFFTVHEDSGTNSLSGTEITLDYGASVIDPKDGTIMFHEGASADTGRGMMADIGAGGYYQIWSAKTASYQSDGGDDFSSNTYVSSASQNFRIFWDGDLYDELLNDTEITSWTKYGLAIKSIFTADGCTSINSTKANPSLTADLFGDWREEVVYPLEDNTGLRVYTTNIYTNYKMKSLMYDAVYRSGVAAEQTAYNQPPHIGYYIEKPEIVTENFYEKGTSSDTAWTSDNLYDFTTSGTATLNYSADNADYGQIYYSVTAPSSSYSATKTFDISDGAIVTYDLTWCFGNVISKNTDYIGTSDANYSYLQFGDNIRVAWYGAPSYYYIYYSTDGGKTYAASDVKYYNQSYTQEVAVSVDTSTNTLLSLGFGGTELVSDVTISDTPKSVTFGFIKGSSDSIYSNDTVVTSGINSILVTQEYEEGSLATEAPTEEPTVAPTEEPTDAPTEAPTEEPTEEPTAEPTEAPTEEPTEEPTEAPTEAPTPTPIVVSAPTGVSAGVTSSSVTVTWNAVENAESYVVSLFNGSDETEKISNVTGTEYTFDSLDAATEYTVKVQAVNGETYSEAAEVKVTTDAAATPEPTEAPTEAPTEEPTTEPTETPSDSPVSPANPTTAPTAAVTEAPTAAPTDAPTEEPTAAPTETPTVEPTAAPTTAPTEEPAITDEPEATPTAAPTDEPEETPAAAPTAEPIEFAACYTDGKAVIISPDNAYDAAAVIFAAYDADGRLIKVSIVTADIAKGEETEVTPSETFTAAAETADEVRIFVWESADSMKPLK